MHIYQSFLANNETYTLKEILKEPEREKFVETMRGEVESMFSEGIWETVPKSRMLDHYMSKRKAGFDVKRHKIMMICSFKRKKKQTGRSSNTWRDCVVMVDSSGGA